MKPLVEKLHLAFLNMVLEYVKRRGIDLFGAAETSVTLEGGGEDFSMISSLISPDDLVTKIHSMHTVDSRKTLLIYLLKSAEQLKKTDSYELVLTILENLHALFSLSNHSMRRVVVEEEEMFLYGFNGWRVSQAASLIQEMVFQRIFNIPDSISSLSWYLVKAMVELRLLPATDASSELLGELGTVVVEAIDSTAAANEGLCDGVSHLTEMQEALLEKDARIRAMEASLAEKLAILQAEQSRTQGLLEELRKIEGQNKGLKASVGSTHSEVAALKEQLAIAQEQLELQQAEMTGLQKKLKEKDKTSTFVNSGVGRSPGLSTIVTQSGTGLFSAGPSLLADGARHRKTVSPGKK